MVLKDRIALVTGASKGIGRATTVVLARCGAVTAIAGRAADGTARDVQAELAAFGRVSDIFPCDLSKAGAAEPLVTDVVERFGRLDILVNNAGLAIPEPLADISHESIAAQVSINLAAPIMLIQTAREHLARNQGTIVNVSSTNAAGPVANLSVYSATKAGLEAVTRALALELGAEGIRVNAVAPGPTDTEMFRGAVPEEMRNAIKAATPLGRLGQPVDIAEAICFLASEAAR